ncbi:AAA ATPase domain-containing protein [Amycolatopsis arida]|uniref:AAA ATPase domain-containing protein n=1 Tax=Amycolatopsis arida TaxID=587909 RepID=A0A1I6AJU9_9PSEU|nr:AAA family ATPase [Amycolatopsis arida]TDX87328.1 AAA ATPase-like protein [Amycolatopsis arida]SFQ68913.1 AAA ATPase domain-containing protein [Amycolatopsis arida]
MCADLAQPRTDLTRPEVTPSLIGRDHPVAVLRAELDRVVDSHGGLVLVTGEAGIGKTALVTGTADDARRRGALVLSGSCWDSDSAPGYWPWMQVARGLRRAADPAEWAAVERSTDGALGVLLGETVHPDGVDAVGGFRLFDAVTTALVSLAQRRPVMVVLDDLHWADPASLKLLEFVAQHTWFERLLLIGTYRDAEVEAADHPLRPLVLPLLAKARTVTLTGLGPDEVGRLITRTVGTEPDPDLVAEVHRRTGGNPFFVEQTARLWHSGGPVTAVAPGVRDAVRRRLSLLPAAVARLLTAAAVLGGRFHRQVLAVTVTSPVAQVDRLLDQAVAARLVVADGGGWFSFAHDLVRETLYETLDEAERRGRHAAVIRATDTAPDLADRLFPGELARHAYLAGPDLEPGRAADLLTAAARDAGARMAFDEAVGHYRRALDLAGPTEPRRRVLAALGLAHELYHHLEAKDEAWTVLTHAVGVARAAGEPELLARVALTVHGTGNREDHSALKAELVTEAYRALLPDAPTPDGGRSLDQLARDLTVHLGLLARQGGDDEALGFSLWTLHDTIWGLGSAAERVDLTRELADIGRRTGDAEMEQFATSLRWVALLELGDPAYADQLRAFVALTERSAQTRMRFAALLDQSIIAAFRGEFAEAATLLARGEEEVPDDADDMHFAFVRHHLRWARLLQQGRFAELAELHRSPDQRHYPFPALIEGITAAQRGDADTALRHLAAAPPGDRPFPGPFQPLWLRFQAQVAAAAADADLRRRARTALEPYAGQWMVSLYGCDISGPVMLWLARLDAGEHRWDSAVDRFTEAYRSADRLGARPWSVEARLGLVEALLGRAADGDLARARTLLAAVERDAAALDLRHVTERVSRLSSDTDSPLTSTTAEAAPATEFRFSGGVWTLTWAGRTVHLPDAKGLRDLHTLLGHPGEDIPAVRLLDPAGGEVVVAARRMGGDAVLDDEAKARYRRRLAVLDDEIDRAVERGADDRAAELDRERAALLDELRTAAGLGGRPRRLGDEAERARKAVTARIRDVLRRLDERHPELAEHLRASVSTGASCRYAPDGGVSWRR